MPRASLCLLYPRGKPELKTKLREEGTTPGTGEDNNQSRKMDCFQRTKINKTLINHLGLYGDNAKKGEPRKTPRKRRKLRGPSPVQTSKSTQ